MHYITLPAHARMQQNKRKEHAFVAQTKSRPKFGLDFRIQLNMLGAVILTRANKLLTGIPQVIAPEDLANPRVDEQSVMTYISYYRNAQPKKRM